MNLASFYWFLSTVQKNDMSYLQSRNDKYSQSN